MGIRKINESTLTAIGNAIRSKTGGSALINPEDMADEIESIQTGGGAVEQTYTITRATTLGSELWNLYVAPLISSYPACATVSVTNYDTSDTLSITSGVLCKRTSSDNGWGNVTRVGGDRAGTDLSSIGAHLAVGAVLSVKAYAFL